MFQSPRNCSKAFTPESRRTFGQAIRQERERLGLSQEEFAERANVHRTYISSIELGNPSSASRISESQASTMTSVTFSNAQRAQFEHE